MPVPCVSSRAPITRISRGANPSSLAPTSLQSARGAASCAVPNPTLNHPRNVASESLSRARTCAAMRDPLPCVGVSRLVPAGRAAKRPAGRGGAGPGIHPKRDAASRRHPRRVCPNVTRLEAEAPSRRRRKRGGGMWSYVAYDAERETRLAERARTRHLVPRRSLRERLDATRSLLSRRERKVLERHSVVLLVPEGGELHAPSPLGTRQFLLLEQGCAGVV